MHTLNLIWLYSNVGSIAIFSGSFYLVSEFCLMYRMRERSSWNDRCRQRLWDWGSGLPGHDACSQLEPSASERFCRNMSQGVYHLRAIGEKGGGGGWLGRLLLNCYKNVQNLNEKILVSVQLLTSFCPSTSCIKTYNRRKSQFPSTPVHYSSPLSSSIYVSRCVSSNEPPDLHELDQT